MKRIYQLAVVAAVLLAPLAASTPASAAFKCEVGFTGPNSENLCISEETFECTVTNTNNVTITNSNNQTAASGTVTVENGTGGGALSGTASNNNNATFNVSIDNSNETQPCVVTASVPATETPETPEEPEPGKGETVQPTQTATPTALPVTSGDTAPVIFLVSGLTVLGALVFAYRRLY